MPGSLLLSLSVDRQSPAAASRRDDGFGDQLPERGQVLVVCARTSSRGATGRRARSILPVCSTASTSHRRIGRNLKARRDILDRLMVK